MFFVLRLRPIGSPLKPLFYDSCSNYMPYLGVRVELELRYHLLVKKIM